MIRPNAATGVTGAQTAIDRERAAADRAARRRDHSESAAAARTGRRADDSESAAAVEGEARTEEQSRRRPSQSAASAQSRDRPNRPVAAAAPRQQEHSLRGRGPLARDWPLPLRRSLAHRSDPRAAPRRRSSRRYRCRPCRPAGLRPRGSTAEKQTKPPSPSADGQALDAVEGRFRFRRSRERSGAPAGLGAPACRAGSPAPLCSVRYAGCDAPFAIAPRLPRPIGRPGRGRPDAGRPAFGQTGLPYRPAQRQRQDRSGCDRVLSRRTGSWRSARRRATLSRSPQPGAAAMVPYRCAAAARPSTARRHRSWQRRRSGPAARRHGLRPQICCRRALVPSRRRWRRDREGSALPPLPGPRRQGR